MIKRQIRISHNFGILRWMWKNNCKCLAWNFAKTLVSDNRWTFKNKLLFYKFLFQYWNNYADHHMFLRKTNLWHHWRSSLFALDMTHLHKIDIYFSVTTYLFIRRFEHINHKKQMDILFWPSRKLFFTRKNQGKLATFDKGD